MSTLPAGDEDRLDESTDKPRSETDDGPRLAAGEDRDSAARLIACDGLPVGGLMVVGLAAGLAAGTKLNFLPPAAVLVVGLAVIAPVGGRGRALVASSLAALAGGGYWYLRNLAHSGNPLPWFDSLGPISLPAPDQPLGGREGHSVLGYLLDGAVWSDWLLPGLQDGLTVLWPLIVGAALAGLLLSTFAFAAPSSLRRSFARHNREKEQGGVEGRGDAVLIVAGLTALAAALAWLIAPTSASGPEGMPRGFESGLRYLAPALALGLVLLPTTAVIRRRLACLKSPRTHFAPHSEGKCVRHDRVESRRPRFFPLRGKERDQEAAPRRFRGTALMPHGAAAAIALALVAAIAIGYPVQRYYLQNRYVDPSFTTHGLNAAFKWARSISGARIATTSTRQYPLYGIDLSNHVQFIGEERPHGGFVAPSTCQTWRRALNAGDYDYAVVTWDRVALGKPPFPSQAAWTEAPGVRTVLRRPPTVVFQLTTPLAPSACS